MLNRLLKCAEKEEEEDECNKFELLDCHIRFFKGTSVWGTTSSSFLNCNDLLFHKVSWSCLANRSSFLFVLLVNVGEGLRVRSHLLNLNC